MIGFRVCYDLCLLSNVIFFWFIFLVISLDGKRQLLLDNSSSHYSIILEINLHIFYPHLFTNSENQFKSTNIYALCLHWATGSLLVTFDYTFDYLIFTYLISKTTQNFIFILYRWLFIVMCLRVTCLSGRGGEQKSNFTSNFSAKHFLLERNDFVHGLLQDRFRY